jgi:hypothetical protein
MKKILCISLTLLLLITMSACVKSKGAASSPAASPDTSVSAGPDSSSDVPGGEQDSSGSVIAESSNTVSDKEVEAILDDLSGELDSALNDAENLEDLDDTDLDVNNIE